MVTAVGTGEDFPQVHDWPAQSGVFFSAEHVTRYAQVVAIGQTVAKNLFPAGTSPLGQYVLIGNAPVHGHRRAEQQGLDPPGRRSGQLRLAALHDGRSAHLRPALLQAHRRAGEARRGHERGAGRTPRAAASHRHGKEDFNIRNMADTIETANETQNTLTYLLAAIAVISLDCRRHRRDEHHAGLGHRTDPRNRHPHGDRRAQLRRVVSVPDRGRDGLLHRRPGRRRSSASAAACRPPRSPAGA